MSQLNRESPIHIVMEDKSAALSGNKAPMGPSSALNQLYDPTPNLLLDSSAEMYNTDKGVCMAAEVNTSTQALHSPNEVDIKLMSDSSTRKESSVLSAGLRLSPVSNGKLLEAAHAVSAEFSHVLEQVTQAAPPMPPPRGLPETAPLRMPPTPPPPTPPPTEDPEDRCSLPSPPPEARQEATPPRPLPPRAPAPPERSSSHSRLNGSSSTNNSTNNTPTIQRRRIVVRAVKTPSPVPFPRSATDEVRNQF